MSSRFRVLLWLISSRFRKEFLWISCVFSCGFHVDFLWISCRFVEFLWIPFRIRMDFLWVLCGSFVVSFCVDFVCISYVFLVEFCGIRVDFFMVSYSCLVGFVWIVWVSSGFRVDFVWVSCGFLMDIL